jgi:hypothetical protein
MALGDTEPAEASPSSYPSAPQRRQDVAEPAGRLPDRGRRTSKSIGPVAGPVRRRNWPVEGSVKSLRLAVRKMASKSCTKWTAEDERRLLELRAAGKPFFVIAGVLRRSAASIRTRLGLLRARSTRQNDELAS